MDKKMEEKKKSIWTRKRDLVYLVFFVVHVPVMLCFDLTHYYPTSLKPTFMTSLREWYIATYNDRFFYNPPPWFALLTLLELTYHLPLTLWAIPALLRNDARIPLALLVFGLETSVSTLVCMAEMWSWEELSAAQRGVGGLGGMYGGYAAVGVFMVVDCYLRLDRILAKQKGIEPVSGKKAL
ncbi:integral membrane protein-like protein [Periconia macrospinosa]|uniref:Efficient mitochondria targeting-associated protein 19 n=1 Tax=Periconia macrospinosa TaxID=97972 RepID=A0A2V1D7Q9_9PLEO|nr:integral membrane protein-like protein [Periconia macrospinosa]